MIVAALACTLMLTAAAARPIVTMTAGGPVPLACDSDVVASGGFFRIILPPASQQADGCDLVIVNNDSAAGKSLVNFPLDVNQRLYPNQSVGITSLAGRWISKSKPGRYRLPGETKVLVDNNGDDDNDGLSAPLRHISVAAMMIQNDFDIQQTHAVIAPTIGQSFVDDTLRLGGQPTGGNLVILAPNGDGDITLINKEPCIIGGDNAELYIWANKYGPRGQIDFYCNRSNMPMTGHIYAHNNFLLDGSGKLVFHGAGLNDNALFFDGPTPGSSITDGIHMAGTFDTIWRMDEGGGRYTLGCSTKSCSSIIPVGDESRAQPLANRMFMIQGAEQLLLGGCPTNGGYESLGRSIISDHGTIVTFGCPIPGGYVTSESGTVLTTKN